MKNLYLIFIVVLFVKQSAVAQSPIISVLPDSLGEELLSGKSITRVLTINNSGGNDLDFEINIEHIQSDLASTKIKTCEDSFIKDLVDLSKVNPSNTSTFNSYCDNSTPIRGALGPNYVEAYNVERTLSSGIKILLIISGGNPTEIKNLLLNFPEIEVVDTFDAEYGFPSLNELLNYHSVILINDSPFGDPIGLGNVLADYVDAGGGLTMTIASFVQGWEIRGRIFDEGYLPFNLGYGPIGSATLGNFNQNHPIMQGVSSAFGDQLAGTTITCGAELIAEWNNGQPFVATKGSNIVAVNIYVANAGLWSGDIPLIIYNSIIWSLGGGWLSAEPSSGSVAAGSSLEVIMTFDASGLSGGDYDANIVVSSNDPVSPEVFVPAHLSVTDAPSIIVNKDSLDFGEVFLGVTDSLEIEVTNNGSQDLLIFSATGQPIDYSVYPTFAGIDPGENEIFTVTFSPQQAGNLTGTLTFISNDPLWSNYTVILNGNGVEPPAIVVSPDSIYIEVLPGTSKTKLMSISNTGASNLSFDIWAVGGGAQNLALQFDGSSGHVQLTDANILGLTNNTFTVESWIYISIYDDNDEAILGASATGRLNFLIRNQLPFMGFHGGNDLIGTTTVLTETWYHIAWRYDMSIGEMAILINGELDSSDQGRSPYPRTGELNIGMWEFDNFFTGMMDEFRIWSVARTEAEIQENMYRELPMIYPELVAYWQFNEGIDDTAYDQTNNGNNGIVHNGADWIESSAPITAGWLSASPDSGICHPNSSMEISLLFDATELDTGDYYSTIYISSNDPIQTLVEVPIHMLVSTTAGVEDEYLIPTVFNLYQNYPNPFNTLTKIKYDIPENARVVFKIYNILGEEVITLVNEEKFPGSFEITWNAENVSSGIYFYNIQAGDFTETKKMILMK